MVLSPSGLRTIDTSDPDWLDDYNYNIQRLHDTLLHFNALGDVNPAGIADGDTPRYDSASGKWKPWHPNIPYITTTTS